MKFGVCYYPEHWPASRWSVDAKMMRALGLQIVRIGEFAWGRMEPEEGKYNWAWLDRAIETLISQELQLVLGTPTAAPPAWLSRNYPDTLPMDEEGRYRNFGGRRHYCPNSATYRNFSQQIVTALAKRYGQNDRLIGWQIDNEFGGGNTARCYCPQCVAAFRMWLSRRYGTIETLNDAWGNEFWSQTYSEWDQIGAPNLVLGKPNPSHILDYYRFASDSYIDYQQLQIDALRAHIHTEQFITHNFMGPFSDLDYFKLAAPLDIATWDSYPTGQRERSAELLYSENDQSQDYAYDTGDPAMTGMSHDLMRGLLGKPFWIMEQQPGHINWGRYNPGIRPGNIRLWVWHALVSGAEAVIFFRWRACLDAQEQYHTGLLRHDGSPDVGYGDLETLQAEGARLRAFAGQPMASPHVALIFDYEDLWALNHQPHHSNFNYLRYYFVFYRALQRLSIPVDIRPQNADLSPYRLVITPTSHLTNPALVESLTEFAHKGGSVLLGIRTGLKTPTNRVVDAPLPGVYRDLIGATVTQWHALPPSVLYDLQTDIPGVAGPATTWAEALATDPDTEIFARYSSGPLEGSAALVKKDVGKGRVWYLGWYPAFSQMLSLITHLANLQNIPYFANLPPGVILYPRGPFLAALNFTDTSQSIVILGRKIAIGPRSVQIVQTE